MPNSKDLTPLDKVRGAFDSLSAEEKAEFRKSFEEGSAVAQEPEQVEGEPQSGALEEAQGADAISDSEVLNKMEKVEEAIETDQAEAAAGEKPDYEKTGSEETELQEALEKDKQSDSEVVAAMEEETDPVMVKSTASTAMPDEETSPNVVDDAGEELPVDYQQIIDGLNAKLAASEAENKMLKSKRDEAFGLSARPSMVANRSVLFDEGADIPKMIKNR